MAISEIEVRDLPEEHTVVIRGRLEMAELGRIPEWIARTMEAVQRAGRQPTGMPFVRTLSMEPAAMEIEVGWPVAEPFTGDGEVIASSLPGGPAAVASYFGPYEEIASTYEAIQAWCRERGREIAGPPWESYFTDPNEEPDQSKWRTDVHFPVKP